MSAEQGDVSLTAENENKEPKSPQGSKEGLPPKNNVDQIDHSIQSKLDELGQKHEGPEASSLITDTDCADKTDPDVDSDDEDLHLQWEDDDDQDPIASETIEGSSKVQNIENDESVDENVLLESSDEMDKIEVTDTVIQNEESNMEDILLGSDNDEKVIKAVDSKCLTESGKTEDLKRKRSESFDLNSSVKETQTKSVKLASGGPGAQDESVIDDKIATTSSPNESLSTIEANVDHRLKNPDAMLEIPTQEIIDLLDETDISMSEKELEGTASSENTLKEIVGKIDEKAGKADIVEKLYDSDKSSKTVPEISSVAIELNSEHFEVDLNTKDITSSSVSEDDWTEIEKRLKIFETSIGDVEMQTNEEETGNIKAETVEQDADTSLRTVLEGDSYKSSIDKPIDKPNSELVKDQDTVIIESQDAKSVSDSVPSQSKDLTPVLQISEESNQSQILPTSNINKPEESVLVKDKNVTVMDEDIKPAENKEADTVSAPKTSTKISIEVLSKEPVNTIDHDKQTEVPSNVDAKKPGEIEKSIESAPLGKDQDLVESPLESVDLLPKESLSMPEAKSAESISMDVEEPNVSEPSVTEKENEIDLPNKSPLKMDLDVEPNTDLPVNQGTIELSAETIDAAVSQQTSTKEEGHTFKEHTKAPLEDVESPKTETPEEEKSTTETGPQEMEIQLSTSDKSNDATTKDKELQLSTSTDKEIEQSTSKDKKMELSNSKDVGMSITTVKEIQSPEKVNETQSSTLEDAEIQPSKSKDIEISPTIAKDREIESSSKGNDTQTSTVKDTEIKLSTSKDIEMSLTTVKEIESSKGNETQTSALEDTDKAPSASKDIELSPTIAKDREIESSSKVKQQSTLEDTEIQPSTSKDIEMSLTTVKEVESSSKGNETGTSTLEDTDMVPSTSKDIEISPTIAKDREIESSSKANEAQTLEVKKMLSSTSIEKEIESSSKANDTHTLKDTEMVLTKDIEISPTIAKDREIESSSKANETQTSTLEDTDMLPSTSKSIEISPTIAKDTEMVLSKDIEVSPTIAKDREIESTQEDTEILPTTSKGTEISPTIAKDREMKSTLEDTEIIQPTSKDIEMLPSTSKDDVQTPKDSVVKPAEIESVPDSSDEAEATDSLGLLAESSRVMEDDEEQDDEEEDEDDYYPEDESSNQMTAEHSEDSNAPHSETEIQKEQEEKETDGESPQEEKEQQEFSFTIDEKEDVTIENEEIIVEEKETEVVNECNEEMDIDQDICEVEVPAIADIVGDEITIGVDDLVVDTAKDKETEDKTQPPKADIETVKLSDTSDTETDADTPLLKSLLTSNKDKDAKSSPSRDKSNVVNIVDLEGSSDDETPVSKKESKSTFKSSKGTSIEVDGASVTIPPEVAVKTVPKDAKKDTSENASKTKHKFSLEIFNLDSDEEDTVTAPKPLKELKLFGSDKTDKKESGKCLNLACQSTSSVYYPADAATVAFYDAGRKRKAVVCEECANVVVRRTEALINGIRELTPLLDLEIGKVSSELVEISDSDSDDTEECDSATETIGDKGAAFIEKELANAINETWQKFKMDVRLTDAEEALNKEMQKLEEETKEIDTLLNECQIATDQLRNDLYATFEQKRHHLSPIVIFDTPSNMYTRLESIQEKHDENKAVSSPTPAPETRSKRRMSSAAESTPKRPAIPMGYTPLESDKPQDSKPEPSVGSPKVDDDKDIAVLKVSMESAPSDLPPPGELTRPPLRPDMNLFAMRNTFGSWAKAKVLEVQGKAATLGSTQNFTICRVKMFSRNQSKTKILAARCLAYAEPPAVRMTIGTRVIAVFKDPMNETRKDTFYSGIIAEVPNPVNNYRYLVFFDDGYAQYVPHTDTRLVCECSPLVWEEVHPFSREFVRKYLLAYPERPMVRLHAGQSLKTEWNGKWWTSRVISVDASLVQVHFEEDNRTEWIYRGSTRLAPLYLELQAAERHRARPMPRTKAQPRVNMPYVEYTRSEEQQDKTEKPPPSQPVPVTAQEREIRQRAVAKKSTAAPQVHVPPAAPQAESVTSRVVYYTPKNAVKPYKMSPHSCGPHCKRKDTLALKDLRTYNPLAKPLLSGWERQIVRFNGHREVMYRAPCGRRLRNMRELHRYLRLVQSDMPVDLFDFTPATHCLAEFVLNKCLVGKKDLSHGKENVPVPCVNYYDSSLPEFCSYNTERTPTAGVPLNLDPEFLCGCDCTDDCEDKSKCACWKMTLEGARTIGLTGTDVGYVYKRLPEPLPSGIYECNSRCKCKQTCLNRVAQHPLQLKLQVFKTLNRGWGIRALNDVPKGSFLCVYAGNLLTDATANMDGLNEGDEYLAELDYIEVVEQMKEGYEEDIPEVDKRLDSKVRDKKDKKNDKEESEEPEPSSSDEELPSKNEEADGDFFPGFIAGVTEFSKRLRSKRDKKKKAEAEAKEKAEREKGEKADDDCITISDDEEVREPSRFTAQAGLESNEFKSKYRSVRSHFGKDEACYIMDAKVQGNIGRYLNHSCMPNVFVQNVFVDTHDPRFPWVAFFALSHIKAGTELTWNYNYDVGSVPGKALYCYCGAPNCRGRLL